MQKYPRLSFRLTPLLDRRISMLALQLHWSRGRVVRTALNQFFEGHLTPSIVSTDTENDETNF